MSVPQFSDAWLLLAIFMIIGGAWFRQPSMLALGLLLLVIVPVAWAWNRLVLRAVHYGRKLGESRVFAGETTSVQLITTNQKPLPAPWLTVEDTFPRGVSITERQMTQVKGGEIQSLTNVLSLRWYERVVRQYTLHCPRRGYYFIGPAYLTGGDLFGLFQNRAKVSHLDRVIVYPAVVPLEELGFVGKDPFGESRSRQPIFEDPLRTVGIRDYHPEDSFRHVHWKATARTGALQSKVFEPTTTIQFGVFLNLDTFEHYWEGIDYERAEDAITATASIAIRALDERRTVGVYANGVSGGSDQPLRVRPSRSPSQRGEVLAGLAKLSPIASINFARLLRAETSRFPMGSTVVIVTALITDATAAVLVDLQRAGHRVVLVTIDEVELPSIRGIDVFKLDSASIGTPRQSRRRYAIQMNPVALAGLVERQRDA